MNLVALVLGFIVWWPLGLAVLAFILWGGDVEQTIRDEVEAFRGRMSTRRTGNANFDDYKDATLAKLEEQKRKLEEEQEAFAEFMQRLRRARDKEEFDQFMADRRNA
jgi:hypothetical protein